MDPGIYEQRAALGPAAVGTKAIDAASFDVDARDLGAVVRCEDRELDSATP